MARSLREDEAEVFKDAISVERRFAFDHFTLERLAEHRDEELELTPESAFWFGSHFPGATNS
jgi:hypothetical protein